MKPSSSSSSSSVRPSESSSHVGDLQSRTEEEEEEEEREEGKEEREEEGSAPTVSFWSSLVSSTISAIESKANSLSSFSIGGRSSQAPHIWLLGVCYSSPDAYPQFLLDFTSRIWLTYRKGFEPIGISKFTSDAGWGCMIRSGQMLLAQALVCHYLGRSWRKQMPKPNSQEYLEILQFFGDCSSSKCIFSIHNLVQAGGRHGIVAGSWLGPYILCRTLEAVGLVDREQSLKWKRMLAMPLLIYVVSGDADGERGGAPILCINDIKDFCSQHVENPGDWPPILLMVPLVLGLDMVNPRYLPLLARTFTFPQSVGIVGGKPGASTYLVGVQGDQVFYLDPHEVQQALPISPDDLQVDTSSYHCSALKQMPLNAIDPSLAIGFYCHSQEDFDDFCTRAFELEKDSNGAPMFTVIESSNATVFKEGQFHELSKEEIHVLETPSGEFKEDQVDEAWQIL